MSLTAIGSLFRLYAEILCEALTIAPGRGDEERAFSRFELNGQRPAAAEAAT